MEDVEVDVEDLHVEKHLWVDVVPQVHGGVPKLGYHGLQINHLHPYIMAGLSAACVPTVLACNHALAGRPH